MLRSNGLRLGVCAAAMALLVAPLISTNSDARGHGGGGGSHGGGSRGGGISHGGGFHGGSIGRSFHSAPAMRSISRVHAAPTVHSLAGTRSNTRASTAQSVTTPNTPNNVRSVGRTPAGALRNNA